MAELVVAFGLLGLILLGSMRLFAMLFASNSGTNLSSIASQVALQKLEEFAGAGTFSDHSDSTGLYTVDAGSATQFRYTIHCEPWSQRTSDPNEVYLGGYLVQVEVYWNAQSSADVRRDKGQQSVRLERFVYPRRSVP